MAEFFYFIIRSIKSPPGLKKALFITDNEIREATRNAGGGEKDKPQLFQFGSESTKRVKKHCSKQIKSQRSADVGAKEWQPGSWREYRSGEGKEMRGTRCDEGNTKRTRKH